MIPVLLLLSSMARAGDARSVTQACVATGASASAVVRADVLSQKVQDAAQDDQVGAQSARAVVTRNWVWRKNLDLCPPDDPMGGLLIPGDNLFEVDGVPKPDEPRTCVSQATAGADGTAEGVVRVDSEQMHLVADGRVDVEVTADNASAVDTRWTGGGRFASRWRWTTPLVGSGTAALTARIRIEASPGAAGSVEIPDMAKLTVWQGRVDGHVRRGATWEAVNAAPVLELVAERVVVGTKGEVCVMGDVSAAVSADRTTRAPVGSPPVDARDAEQRDEPPRSGRLKEAAHIEVAFEVVERSDYPALAKDGPVFNPCGCP